MFQSTMNAAPVVTGHNLPPTSEPEQQTLRHRISFIEPGSAPGPTGQDFRRRTSLNQSDTALSPTTVLQPMHQGDVLVLRRRPVRQHFHHRRVVTQVAMVVYAAGGALMQYRVGGTGIGMAAAAVLGAVVGGVTVYAIYPSVIRISEKFLPDSIHERLTAGGQSNAPAPSQLAQNFADVAR